ncbi:hypothetical protein SPHINGO391_510211 [Sphingomonas aurantiaca]|uniref:Uncharacterized protein n=1 Tax=Sphingomonas aurantiaca TaxID=185949 RepID=A0A5E8AFN1_9SPHN|nr:hypothetical protein SPHINGO391_510211 [Sphingomonas aurantiaca]
MQSEPPLFDTYKPEVSLPTRNHQQKSAAPGGTDNLQVCLFHEVCSRLSYPETPIRSEI